MISWGHMKDTQRKTTDLMFRNSFSGNGISTSKTAWKDDSVTIMFLLSFFRLFRDLCRLHVNYLHVCLLCPWVTNPTHTHTDTHSLILPDNFFTSSSIPTCKRSINTLTEALENCYFPWKHASYLATEKPLYMTFCIITLLTFAHWRSISYEAVNCFLINWKKIR